MAISEYIVNRHILDQILAKNSNQRIRRYFDGKGPVELDARPILYGTNVGQLRRNRLLVDRLHGDRTPNVAVGRYLQLECAVQR